MCSFTKKLQLLGRPWTSLGSPDPQLLLCPLQIIMWDRRPWLKVWHNRPWQILGDRYTRGSILWRSKISSLFSLTKPVAVNTGWRYRAAGDEKSVQTYRAASPRRQRIVNLATLTFDLLTSESTSASNHGLYIYWLRNVDSLSRFPFRVRTRTDRQINSITEDTADHYTHASAGVSN